MGGVDQGGVVGFGEAAAFTLALAVNLDPVQQACALSGLDADESGDRNPAEPLPDTGITGV